MPVTAQDQIGIILLEVGAGLTGLPDKVLAAVLDKVTPLVSLIWEMWNSKSYYPMLQKEYVRRECVKLLLGQHRDLIPISIQGFNIAQQTLFQNLKVMLDDSDKEIQRLEKEYIGTRPPALGLIASTVLTDDVGRVFNPLQNPGKVRGGWPWT